MFSRCIVAFSYSCVLALLATPFVLGAEVRELTMEDLDWGDPATTVTSAAGHVGYKIPQFGDNTATATMYADDVIVKGPWVDVRSYLPAGFVTDGSVDYAKQVQSALTSLPDNATLLFPVKVGVGSTNWAGLNLRNKQNVTIRGMNGGGMIVRALPTQQDLPHYTIYVAFAIRNSRSVKIVDMDFDGNGVKSNLLSFDNVSHSSVRHNYFHNAEFSDYAAPLLVSDGGTKNDFSFNKFVGGCYQLVVGIGGPGGVETHSMVTGNTFGNPRGCFGGTLHHSLINGNTFVGCDVGINIGGDTEITHDLSITGNVVRNCMPGGSAYRTDVTGGLWPYNIVYTGNTSDNCDTGFGLSRVRDSILSGNVITHTKHYGLGGDSNRNMVIVGNYIESDNTGLSGIIIQGGTGENTIHNILIANNIVTGFTGVNGSGIYVTGQVGASNDNVIISGNITTKNKYGIWTSQVNNVFMDGNMASGNITHDIRNDVEAFTDAYGAPLGAAHIYGSNNKYSTRTGVSRIRSLLGTGTSLSYSPAVPTDNAIACVQGDFVFSTSQDNVIGWKCVIPGSPGTWQSLSAP